MSNYTFKFGEIFDTYEKWKTFSEECGFINFTDETEAKFDEYCYKVLFRHYQRANIRYTSIADFCNELSIVYESKFKQFKKQQEVIDKIYNLTEDEILQVNQVLSNYAENPNNKPDDPTKPLNFITNQTYTNQQNGKLSGYLLALSSIPVLDIYSFLRKSENDGMSFNELFMVVLPNEIDIF